MGSDEVEFTDPGLGFRARSTVIDRIVGGDVGGLTTERPCAVRRGCGASGCNTQVRWTTVVLWTDRRGAGMASVFTAMAPDLATGTVGCLGA